MKKLFLSFIASLFLTFLGFAQTAALKTLPEYTLPAAETEAHLRFIASDELQGRYTGDPGSRVAARYIAEQFRLFGLTPAAGQPNYFQNIVFSKTENRGSGKLILGTDTLKIGKDAILASEGGVDLQNTPYVFLPYGWSDSTGYNDYKNADVKGKIVVVRWGTPDTATARNMRAQNQASRQKEKLAKDAGAVALVEFFTAPVAWSRIVRNFGRGGLTIKDDAPKEAAGLPHCIADSQFMHKFMNAGVRTASLQIVPPVERLINSPNVVGVLEGSDPALKGQYIILSAHYDHLGMIPKDPKKPDDQDTIFNGARDNGFGCSALLLAAKSFSIKRPRRSVVFISFTGEEEGLFGSAYYADHPLLPLNQCVYAFDTDGAGYNDTTVVTTIGLNRTDCQTEIEKAAAAFGLKVIDDPAPEQNLFDRSDNVSFARKGIPSPDFAPGFTKFDGDILKYYHQLGDEAESVNFSYFHRYCQTYVYAARLIANRDQRPQWRAGDKYEKAYKALYGK